MTVRYVAIRRRCVIFASPVFPRRVFSAQVFITAISGRQRDNAVRVDVKAGASFAVTGGVLSGGESTIDEHAGAALDAFRYELCLTFPSGNVEPFGVFTHFVAYLVATVNGDAEVCHRGAVGRIP